jgi:pimeloyl-ACP methyl ester carboxylesterase
VTRKCKDVLYNFDRRVPRVRGGGANDSADTKSIGTGLLCIIAALVALAGCGTVEDEMGNKTIYRSDEARQKLMEIYDARLAEWPVPWENRFVNTDYGVMHVVICGREGGPPVLLLHASAMSAWSWVDNVGALADSFRVYAFDLIGEAGKSSLSDVSRYPNDLAAIGGLYSALCDSLGVDSTYVVGASNGGLGAMSLALRSPDRVRKLVLLGPMGVAPFTIGAALRMVAAQFLPISSLRERTTRWAIGSSPHVLDRCGEWFSWVMKGTFPAVMRPRALTQDEMAKVTMPVLLVLGTRDPLVGKPEKARAAALFPDLRVEVLDSGHLVGMEQAAAVNRLLTDFLR